MDRAYDIATGELTLASNAKARRAYKCPQCLQRVIVKEPRLSNRMRHFAHYIGVGSPSCEFYFPPNYRYSGRAAKRVYRAETDRLQSDHLELTIASHGPNLALCLPPAGQKEWVGSLQFSAHRISRRLNWRAVQHGQRIEFPLFDGRWSLIPEGAISTEYLENVQLGVQSLEAGTNLFYVERSLGRRVLPAESISCGESIRWLSRQIFHLPLELRDVIHVTCEYQANGWTLNRLAIPSELTSEQTRVLTEWLQRRVIARRARVWIETPWANGYTPQGMPIYPPNVQLTLLADQPMDMQVRTMHAAGVLAKIEGGSRLVFVVPDEDTIEIIVNDYHYEFLQIGSAPKPINALVQIADAEIADISDAQRLLNSVISTGRDRCPVLVSVGYPEVFELVKAHGQKIEYDEHALRMDFAPGYSLRIDKLGELHWPTPAIQIEPMSSPTTCNSLTKALREKILWLSSVSTQTRNSSNIRIQLPKALAQDPAFASLSKLSWSVQWTPHIRQFQRDLENLYP